MQESIVLLHLPSDMSEEKDLTLNDVEMISRTDKNEENRSRSEDGILTTHSDTAMLEDEEMPTYISVSTSSKCEDSDVSNTKQHDEELPMKEQPRSPCISEQGGTSSVYLLSSGEDTDPRYNDEDDGDYGDSDDMEDIDLESEHDNAILDEDEMEDEDNEDEYKRNCFETTSDCVSVKSKLKRSYKDKSLSLQDLSICHNKVRDQDLGKRHRYKHIESKVKRYIKDIKEQNRFSMERRLKDQESQHTTEHTTERNRTDITGTDIEQMKSTKSNKLIKDYAERAIKDLEVEETYTNNKNIYITQIAENGEVDNKPLADCKQDMKSAEMDLKEKEFLNMEEKNKKRNGSVQSNALNHTYSQGTLHRNAKLVDQNEPSVNGHQLTLFNLRTLTYDEYLHGNINFNQDTQLHKDIHVEQHENSNIQSYSEVDVINDVEGDNSNAPCSLKIENVKSIRVISEESKDNTENIRFEKINEEINKTNFENTQIKLLKTQLDQKTIEFNTLKDTYQSTLEENLRMKQELETLKVSLAKYNKEHEGRETKVVAVQTDIVTGTLIQQDAIAGTKEIVNNTVSASSITSVSSSINQWTDSAGSSNMSMKPPNLGTILNSEDSLITTDDTSRKVNRPLSKAFITSSRILRTLSSITQGRSKSEIKSNTRNVYSKKRQSENDESINVKENDGSIIAGSNAFTTKSPSNTKKRKATEMLGSSTFLQPSKIPHTAELKRKSLTIADFNGDFKTSDNNYNGIRIDTQKNRISKLSRSPSPTNIEDKVNQTKDIECEKNNVKCFIYQEDENIDDRSILIQAEIPNNDQESSNTGCIRECGPYLLGNVEVHMSEVNGTINIWGKEVSQRSVVNDDDDEDDEDDDEDDDDDDNDEDDRDDEDDEDVEDEEKQVEVEERRRGIETTARSPAINNKCTCFQNTPHRKFNGSKIVCSTNKKEKIPPQFSEDSNCQCLHVPDRSNTKIHASNLLSPSISAPCGKCVSLNYRRECSIDKRHSDPNEKSHSCCAYHHTEHLEKDCKYACDCERRKNNNDSPCCTKEGYCSGTTKKFSSRNTSDFRKSLYSIINPTVDAKEVICKHRTTCRRSSLHNTEANFQNDMKCCNTIRETSHTCKATLGSMGNRDNGVEHFYNHSPTSNEDDLPFTERDSSETPEMRQRRSSGKKVRGILMDLLKSCGDYRNSSTSSSKKCTSGKDASHSLNCSPQINVTSCNSSDVGCSNLQQSTGRCCHAYARRIESQLEEFRQEMARVRTRSDAILNLINMLHSFETN